MAKNAEIKARMKVLEDHFKRSGNQLGKEAGLGNATVNDWNDNQLGNPTLHCKQFLTHHNIREEWWKTGKGDIFNTSVQKGSDNKEKPPPINPEDIYRKIVEGDTEYVLIPRAIFEDKYKLVAIEKIEQDKRIIEWLLGENEKYSAKLRESDPQRPAIKEAKEETRA